MSNSLKMDLLSHLPVNKLFFNRWAIQVTTEFGHGNSKYRFYIYIHKTNQLQYSSQKIYSSYREASLAAYFVCLRAILDRGQYPALIIDITSRKILSVNLSAFLLFSMDVVGLETIDLISDCQQHEKIYRELDRTGTFNRPLLLSHGDGQAIACQVQVEVDRYYPQWAVFGIVRSSLSDQGQVISKHILSHEV